MCQQMSLLKVPAESCKFVGTDMSVVGLTVSALPYHITVNQALERVAPNLWRIGMTLKERLGENELSVRSGEGEGEADDGESETAKILKQTEE